MQDDKRADNFNTLGTGNHRYASADMVEAEQIEAKAAFDRVVKGMARTDLRNRLYLDPNAADAFGGKDKILEKLEEAYGNNLSAILSNE